MATMNVSLPDQMRDWVESKIADGQYANNSDYVRDLIRKDQQQASKLKAMQEAITAGLQSGEAQDFNADAFKQRMLESLKSENL